jgi:hypothetical protein
MILFSFLVSPIKATHGDGRRAQDITVLKLQVEQVYRPRVPVTQHLNLSCSFILLLYVPIIFLAPCFQAPVIYVLPSN